MSDNPLLVLQQKVSPKPLVEAAKLADAAPLDKHALCLQILQDGYVQSFVDFFYLTHKPDAPAAAAGDDDEQQGDGRFELPADQLEFVRRSLCDAEAARRRSETKEVFASYQALAALFASMDDYKTSVYFREKCLEIARLVADTEGELVASRELGVAHEQLGHKLESIQFFEKAHQLARGNPEQGARSNRDLVLAYRSYAKQLEADGDAQAALGYHERCVQSAHESQDGGLIGTARYHLGQCFEALKQPARAVEEYRAYLELCEAQQDHGGQGMAAFALASAYQQLGDTESAVTHLEAFIRLAQGTGQVRSQAEACNSLGVILSEQGDARSALAHFERFFELARSLDDRRLTEQARVNLGAARGNVMMGAYMQAATSDVSALLSWKARRAPLGEAGGPQKQE